MPLAEMRTSWVCGSCLVLICEVQFSSAAWEAVQTLLSSERFSLHLQQLLSFQGGEIVASSGCEYWHKSNNKIPLLFLPAQTELKWTRLWREKRFCLTAEKRRIIIFTFTVCVCAFFHWSLKAGHKTMCGCLFVQSEHRYGFSFVSSWHRRK